MKFLFINQAFPPDVAASGQHLADLANHLVARGHHVTILAARRSCDDPSIRFVSQSGHGFRLLRIGSTGFGKYSRLGRVLDALSFMFAAAIHCLSAPRPDVIVSLSSPPFVGVLAACVALLRRSRLVHWVMDLQPDEAIAAGWVRPGTLVARTLEAISRSALSAADLVVVLDRFMHARLTSKGISSTPIAVIPPWSHDPIVSFDDAGRQLFRNRHGLNDKFVVMYSGNHSVCHPLDTVLLAARQLQADPDIMFCFVGGGVQFRVIQSRLAGQGSQTSSTSNVICLPYQPLHQLSASLSAADLHLVVMGNDFVGVVHPCKIYNVMQVGSPILYVGPVPSPVEELLRREDPDFKMHSCARHGEVEKLVSEIHRIRSSSHRATRQSWPGCERFSAATLVPHFVGLLEALLCPSRPLANPAPLVSQTHICTGD